MATSTIDVSSLTGGLRGFPRFKQRLQKFADYVKRGKAGSRKRNSTIPQSPPKLDPILITEDFGFDSELASLRFEKDSFDQWRLSFQSRDSGYFDSNNLSLVPPTPPPKDDPKDVTAAEILWKAKRQNETSLPKTSHVTKRIQRNGNATSVWSPTSQPRKSSAQVQRESSNPRARNASTAATAAAPPNRWSMPPNSTYSSQPPQHSTDKAAPRRSEAPRNIDTNKAAPQRPIIDTSDKVGVANSESLPTPSRRFEVKTDSLLKPVSTNDAAARRVSDTIASLNRSDSGRARAGTNRSIDLVAKRRSLGDGGAISGGNSPVVQSYGFTSAPARRFSQPAIQKPYLDGSGADPLASGTVGHLRASSRLSDRIKDLERNVQRNTGREQVLNKLHGGVAAKLARFESTASSDDSATASPTMAATGSTDGSPLIRSTSTLSNRVSASSDMYSIEGGGSSRITRPAAGGGGNGTTGGTPPPPGSISDVYDDSFKKKLENVAGNIAEKVQKASRSNGIVDGSSPTLGTASTMSAAGKRAVSNGSSDGGQIPRSETVSKPEKKTEGLNISGVDELAPVKEERPVEEKKPASEKATKPSLPTAEPDKSSRSSQPLPKNTKGLSILVSTPATSADSAKANGHVSPPLSAKFQTFGNDKLVDSVVSKHKSTIDTKSPSEFNPASLPQF